MRSPGKITGSEAGIGTSRINSQGLAPRHSAASLLSSDLPSQGGGRSVKAACLPYCRRHHEPVGPLRSTGITPLPRYYGPIRHPLAVHPLPISGYRADLAPPLARWGEEGFSSRSTCPCHRAAALTPPERTAASARCDGPCCLRLSTVRLGLRGSSFSGPPLHSLTLRPGDSLTIHEMASRWASSSRFPSTMPSTLRGLWLLPRRD